MKSLRLYSPLNVTTFIYDEEGECYSHEAEEVYNDVEYYKNIKEALKNYLHDDGEEVFEGNIMKYFDYYESGDDVIKSIREKVESAIVGVTVLKNKSKEKMFGICDLKLKDDLTQTEQKVLYEYIEGQYGDGIGEGFEQQDIDVDVYAEERQIQAHLWQNKNFSIKTESEIKAEGYIDLHPQMWEEDIEQEVIQNNDIDMSM